MRGDYQEIHWEIIDQCRKGDRRAQYRLYKLYSRAMYNICTRMVGNKIDAEDILQESFIKVFNNLESYRSESTFGSWLKTIVINSCINFLKRKKLLLVDAENSGIDEIQEENEEKLEIVPETLQKTIKELPEGARVIFNLFAMEDYKHKEIAEMLNISESTSKSQYQRARSMMQEKLKQITHDELA